jgi:pilus assembly protein CpaE
VTSQGVRAALQMGRAIYPYVVVDLDRTYAEEQIEALLQSDVILLVLRLDFTSLRNTRQTLEHLERLGVDRQKVRLVVNRYGQPKEMRMAQAEEALGLKVFSYIPDEPMTINKANNNGVPVVLDAPKSKVASSLLNLASSLNGAKKS